MPEEPTAHALPVPGDLLAGKYRIERLLGRGGMGAVFAANHEILLQRVAIKVMLGELARDAAAVARFLNEARAMARIQDEHVARVMDVGTLEDGSAFMVLEYLDGMDMSDLIESRGPLPLGEAVDYAAQILEALAQAHALGIVHRDLKPSNLFLTRRPNGTACVKLLDFGISKGASAFGAPSSAITTSGAIMGSPMYMSPEQLRSSKDVDARTDIWSLGVVLYELLASKPPFDGETVGEVLVTVVEAVVPPLPNRPDIPPAFEAILVRCLTKKPAERFGSAIELAVALRPFASPVALSSIERVSGMDSRPWPHAVSKERSTAATQALAQPAKSGSWAPPSGTPTRESKNAGSPRRLVVGLAGGTLLIAAAMALAFSLRHGGAAPPPAGPIVSVPSPAPLPAAVEAAVLPATTTTAGAGQVARGHSSPPSESEAPPPPSASPPVTEAPVRPRAGKGTRSGAAPRGRSPSAVSTYDPSRDSRQ